MRHLPLILALLTIAGCATAGNADLARERPAIERTVMGYLHAFVAGDVARACGYLDGRAQDQVSKALGPHVDVEDDCASLLGAVHDHLDAAQLAEARRDLARRRIVRVRRDDEEHDGDAQPVVRRACAGAQDRRHLADRRVPAVSRRPPTSAPSEWLRPAG